MGKPAAIAGAGLFATLLTLPAVLALPSVWESLGRAWGLISPGQWYGLDPFASVFFDALITFLILFPVVYNTAVRIKLPKVTAVGLGLLIWVPVVVYLSMSGRYLFTNAWTSLVAAWLLALILIRLFYGLFIDFSGVFGSAPKAAVFMLAIGLSVGLTSLVLYEFLDKIEPQNETEENATEITKATFASGGPLFVIGLLALLVGLKHGPSMGQTHREAQRTGSMFDRWRKKEPELENEQQQQKKLETQLAELAERNMTEMSHVTSNLRGELEGFLQRIIDTTGVVEKVSNEMRSMDTSARSTQVSNLVKYMRDLYGYAEARFPQAINSEHLLYTNTHLKKIVASVRRILEVEKKIEEQVKHAKHAADRSKAIGLKVSELTNKAAALSVRRKTPFSLQRVMETLQTLLNATNTHERELETRLEALRGYVTTAKKHEESVQTLDKEFQEMFEQGSTDFLKKLRTHLGTASEALQRSAQTLLAQDFAAVNAALQQAAAESTKMLEIVRKRETDIVHIEEHLTGIQRALQEEDTQIEELLHKTQQLYIDATELAILNEGVQAIEEAMETVGEVQNGVIQSKVSAERAITTLREVKESLVKRARTAIKDEKRAAVHHPEIQDALGHVGEAVVNASKDFLNQVDERIAEYEKKKAEVQDAARQAA